MKQILINIALYGLLGGLLAAGGINALEQPIIFLLILVNVGVIDLCSHVFKD